MPLAAGDKLGAYEIVAAIGKGGMGEVWRARDPRLGRDVAIKVSAQQFTDRFEREARAIASLNHPNVCTLYHIGPDYLVMEYIEGPTLADRIKEGPIPLDEALGIARQIADALEVAHEKSIVHRDLKPANVKIRPDGSVKVLDFGLAKAGGKQEVTSDSPTMMPGTQMGMILGTAGYMSPEQARGKEVDKRADIWAFGVLLYEMVTGKRLFEGETVSDSLAAVLTREPDWTHVPAKVQRVLRWCLEKDPKQRLRDIGDAERLLDEELPMQQELPVQQDRPRSRAAWLIACTATAAALGLGLVSWRHLREEPVPVLRFSVAPPEQGFIDHTNGSAIALSPNGKQLAFVANSGGKSAVWVRELSSLITRRLPETEGTVGTPFWSPDNRYVAFFSEGKLKRIDAAGGPALTVCDADPGRSGTWNKNGVIVFQPGGADRLFQVPAAGGNPTPVTTLESDEAAHRFPWFLPDGRHFLFTAIFSNNSKKTAVYVGDIQTGTRRLIVPRATNAMYSPPGYVIYMNENVVMAQLFDAGAARTAGDPSPIAEQVDYSPNQARGQFSVSQNGVFAYLPRTAGGGTNQLGWYDRTGKSLGPVGAPGPVLQPAISPDEESVVFVRQSGTGSDLWIRDLKRGTETRFTINPSTSAAPIWSPNGDHIVFASRGNGVFLHLYQRPASGSGQDEPLLATNAGNVIPYQWSRDGRFIVYGEQVPKTKGDVWVLPAEAGAADRKPIPFLRTDADESLGQLSPDSHWMAFTSDRSGKREVYVRPFPPSEGEWTVSLAGGQAPRWRGDGKELFFEAADGKMTAVPVKAVAGPKPSFDAGAPIPLFDAHMARFGTDSDFEYDVTADGKRFLINTNRDPGAASAPPLNVVTNWKAELKK